MFKSRIPERVLPLPGAPQSSVGAPLPVVLSDERQTFVIYLVQPPPDPDWDGTTVTSVDLETRSEVAVACFAEVWACTFGAPNDEAIMGHPLAAEGLGPYGAFSVEGSSWKTELAARNAVHPQHRPEYLDTLTHFVLTFHDSTFECVAKSVVFERAPGSIGEVAEQTARRLGR